MPEEVTQVMSAVVKKRIDYGCVASEQGSHRTPSFTKSIYSY